MLKSWSAASLAVMMAIATGALAVDASVLKPPPGAKVAIVMFQDLECPECAGAYPLVWEAANAHKVPVVLHDFPLPRHNWSFEAAVWARYFDTTDPGAAMGNEFRRFVYANQRQITRENLQQWVRKFGDEHKLPIPPVNDPDGRLAEKVKADFILGQRIGIEHTPTIWVITNGAVSQPLVEEVKDRGQLSQMIEEMLRKAQTEIPPGKTPARKSPPGQAKKHSKRGAKR
jgi:protein-disulfide isomerase